MQESSGFDKQSSNAEVTTLSPETELLIERLVDDELTEEERTELLTRLDETIDGWRYCALSFLEAQSFRSAFRRTSDRASKCDTSEIRPHWSQTLPAFHSQGRRLPKFAVSVASGILVAAVVAGVMLNFRSNFSNSQSAGPSLAIDKNHGATARDVDFPRDAKGGNLSVGSSPVSNAVNTRTVVLNSPSMGLSNVAAPCREAANYDPSSMEPVNAAIPQEVVNHMYNVGGSLHAHRDEYRFPLDDDRVLILPVDTYNVSADENQRIW